MQKNNQKQREECCWEKKVDFPELSGHSDWSLVYNEQLSYLKEGLPAYILKAEMDCFIKCNTMLSD